MKFRYSSIMALGLLWSISTFSVQEIPVSASQRWLSFIQVLATQIVDTWTKPYRQEGTCSSSHTDQVTQATQTAQCLQKALTHINHIDPQSFLVGASTSEHQCSTQCEQKHRETGNYVCNWDRWADKNNLRQPSTMDLWNNYQSYFDYAKNNLGLNSIRFSIEWALVQPQEGTFDQEALDHYAKQFVYAINKGITPIVCFHHYTSPCWFEDKGGFETTNNTQDFADYCKTVYEVLAQRLKQEKLTSDGKTVLEQRPPLFVTFNSPEASFKGYKLKQGPPSNPEKSGLSWAVRVLGNQLYAHVEAYKAIKESHTQLHSASLPEPKIGFLKNVTQLDPVKRTWTQWFLSPLTRLCCTVGETVQADCVYNFFTSGLFKCDLTNTYITHKDAPKSLDFIGLNYYSNSIMQLSKKLVEDDERYKTANDNYRFYPEGLYRAVAELSDRLTKPLSQQRKTAIPIYVTENGFATSDDTDKDHEKRNRFYQHYLQALTKAVQDGNDVRGYLTWTLANNYEWVKSPGEDTRRIYGLCTVSDNGKQLTAKPGAKFFSDFARIMTNKK